MGRVDIGVLNARTVGRAQLSTELLKRDAMCLVKKPPSARELTGFRLWLLLQSLSYFPHEITVCGFLLTKQPLRAAWN